LRPYGIKKRIIEHKKKRKERRRKLIERELDIPLL